MSLLKTSLVFSITVQILTVIIGLIGLNIVLPIKDTIFTSLIGLETIVSGIQLSFYSWYFYNFGDVSHSTFYRYHDWVITTPLMLFTTMMYYDYNTVDTEPTTIHEFWKKHKKEILIVFAFNALMLAFGYLYEVGFLDIITSTILGFVGLFGSFYIQYDAFAKYSQSNIPLFISMLGIWSLYGVAALFTPTWKNISYNIIDTFSKNFYCIFLTYIAYSKRVIQSHT